MRFAVDRLDHLVITCRDVEITASWYQRVLGMDREAFGEQRRNALRFGGQKINLRPETATQEEWFTGPADFPRVTEGLQAVGLSDTEVHGILGGNWLRLFDEVFPGSAA